MDKPIVKLAYGSKTDPGKIRKINEDNLLLESWSDALLAVVADGMGGHKGGEVAAKIAVDTFRELLDQPLPKEPVERYEQLLKKFYDADTAIREQSSQEFRLMDMGTTLMAAIVTPTEYIHLYAGDCRLYHFHQGEFTYISADHSVVRILQNLGKITPEEAATHPMRSVVNSCLGGKGNTQFSVDPKWDDEKLPVLRELCPGDVLLLCSDGLNSEVSDNQLQNLVQQSGNSTEELTKACAEAALEHGGKDNITVIAIQVQEEDQQK